MSAPAYWPFQSFAELRGVLRRLFDYLDGEEASAIQAAYRMIEAQEAAQKAAEQP